MPRYFHGSTRLSTRLTDVCARSGDEMQPRATRNTRTVRGLTFRSGLGDVESAEVDGCSMGHLLIFIRIYVLIF